MFVSVRSYSDSEPKYPQGPYTRHRTTSPPSGPSHTANPRVLVSFLRCLLQYMGSSAEEYAAFKEKVKRTVYIDNLSPQVTESVLRTALDQFATVKSIKFIPNYIEPRNVPQCALVEMDSIKKAKEVVLMITQYPFMISGMPRPVRARHAEEEMFDDRPIKPGRKITCRWVEPGDPDFEVAQELKRLTRKHAAEAAFLHKQQLREEEKLAMQQTDTLKGHYKKFKMIESIMVDGTAQRLARQYNLRVSDD